MYKNVKQFRHTDGVSLGNELFCDVSTLSTAKDLVNRSWFSFRYSIKVNVRAEPSWSLATDTNSSVIFSLTFKGI